MPRSFNEPWEPEDIFDREEAAARRQRMNEMMERNAVLAAQEEAAEERRRAESSARARQANNETIINQYRAAGVQPLSTNADGVPLVSLTMLLSMGWKVIEFEGEPTLVRPQHTSPPRKRREDYDDSN